MKKIAIYKTFHDKMLWPKYIKSFLGDYKGIIPDSEEKDFFIKVEEDLNKTRNDWLRYKSWKEVDAYFDRLFNLISDGQDLKIKFKNFLEKNLDKEK